MPFRLNLHPSYPIKVTDDNRQQFQKQYPGVGVFRDKRCPICDSYLISWREGRWQHDANGKRTIHCLRSRVVCPFCQQLTAPWLPDNDKPPLPVTPNADGWVRCPHCGKLFTLRDRVAYRDGRHRTCGQRLVPPPP